jgi:hypothetical protein
MRVPARKKILAGTAAGVMLSSLVLGSAPAWADDPVGDPAGVQVNVEVTPTGNLTMTVDTSSPVQLVESGSEAPNRTYTGTLPLVTVTDTRNDVPEGVAWSVVGQSSDFVNQANSAIKISNKYLGWAPKVQDVPAGDDTVAPGPEVESTELGGDGLTSGVDLLVSTWDSGDARECGGKWTADAKLNLVTPAADVKSGNYTATLTMSLFEY